MKEEKNSIGELWYRRAGKMVKKEYWKKFDCSFYLVVVYITANYFFGSLEKLIKIALKFC